MLQNHIAQNGGIEIERLYEPPFTTIHAESIDGIFHDAGAVDELLAILSVFEPKRAIQRATSEPSIMSTLTTQLKSDIDKLWTEFWTGGITNPLTVIEQISFLMFARLLDVDGDHGRAQGRAHQEAVQGRFTANDAAEPRWSNFKQLGRGEEMLGVVRDKVFPHFRKLNGGTTFAEYMQDAQLMIQKPSLLVSAVNMIDKLPHHRGRRQGRPLRVPAQQADHGRHQRPVPHAPPHHPLHGGAARAEAHRDHRRPGVRHRRLPRRRDAVPARDATLRRKGSSKSENGEIDLHRRPARAVPRPHPDGMFHGFDFDATMLRIASMNLMLHGVDNPDIHYQDTLSNSFPEKFPKQARRLRRGPGQPAVQGQPRRGRRAPVAARRR